MSAHLSTTIAYVPMEFVGNAYTDRMREILSRFGNVVAHEGVKAWIKRLLKGHCWRYDVLFVNWMENGFIQPDTGRLNWRATGKLWCKTVCLVLSSRKTVFVRHNLYPHGTHPQQRDLLRRLVDAYAKLFSVVIVHSGATVKAGQCYLPHPLYRLQPACAGVDTFSSMPATPLPKDYFLIFGRIVPYKNIEALLDYLPDKQTLVVAGMVGDQDYATRLSQRQRANFIVRAGHLDEVAAQRLVAGARAVLITHAEENVVVSGTFFYAMSLACPVLALETPFLRWVAPRIGQPWLTLAQDLPQLGQHMATFQTQRTTPSQRHALQMQLEHEFGDAVIHERLSHVLNMGGMQ